jgi:hypothetical protein
MVTRYIALRVKRIEYEIKQMPPDRHAALVSADSFGQLHSTIQSAAALCTKFGTKGYLRRLLGHQGHAAKFAHIHTQLNDAISDLKLLVVLDLAGFRDVQMRDNAEARRMLEEIRGGIHKAQESHEETRLLVNDIVLRDKAKEDWIKKGGDESQFAEL